jgi:hypothetical protein
MPDLNRPAFEAAEKRLTAQGHFVINPHRISEMFGTAKELAESFAALYGVTLYGDSGYSPTLARAVMDADLAAVRSCDAIYLLRGWEKSRGAKKELAEALKHNLEIIEEGSAE